MPLALECGILLGIGDSSWNTQIISLLATRYKQQSAEAFAIWYFFMVCKLLADWFVTEHYFVLVFSVLIGISHVFLQFSAQVTLAFGDSYCHRDLRFWLFLFRGNEK